MRVVRQAAARIAIECAVTLPAAVDDCVVASNGMAAHIAPGVTVDDGIVL